MKEVTIRGNERSWVIDVISLINSFCDSKDLKIVRAGGENTVSTSANTMFPDVILYGDNNQSVILQGWEAKMPDVPIDDKDFVHDAQRKALSLGLNSCLLWNFTYAVLYIKNDTNNNFEIAKTWDATSHIKTREDVKTYRSDWVKLLYEIILEVNEYLIKGVFRESPFKDVISTSIMTSLINRNKSVLAETLKKEATSDTRLESYIDDWWSEARNEYIKDETDKYSAYSKVILLNWANRVCFAHLIKTSQKAAFLIDDLNIETSPISANQLFDSITSRSDFYNIFSAVPYNYLLPNYTWRDIVDYSNFLKDVKIQNLDQKILQDIMERSVTEARRQLNGQYTTPYELAKILARITITNWNDIVLDCCCGTGTIAKAVLDIKKEKLPVEQAVASVWASDKYKYLLQIANISMADADTIKLPNIIFKHNALDIKPGEKIDIVNPENGENMTFTVPYFDVVISNLPFIQSSNIPIDDSRIIKEDKLDANLSGRLDLYGYIALKIADILKPGGRLGVVLSNSWLGTGAGDLFVENIRKKYNVLQVHISGRGRWFKNADVVTTLLILERKDDSALNVPKATFSLWKKSLEEIESNSEIESEIINTSVLNKDAATEVIETSKYSSDEIDELLNLGVSRNALFYNIKWLLDISDKTTKISDEFEVIRGSRRGWDKMFYPDPKLHNIESDFLVPVLLNARSVRKLDAAADGLAFSCNYSIDDLVSSGKKGALAWINAFKDQKNGTGKPLPEVLKQSGSFWYELKSNEKVDYFTSINPSSRLFFGKFSGQTFINQRLVGLKNKSDESNSPIYHAMLNSIFTMFMVEAAGFGRGLGVLDINKDKIAKCRILNPRLLTDEQKNYIIEAFNTLKQREILNTVEELKSADRIEFEKRIFESFGIQDYYEPIKKSLLTMQSTRLSVGTLAEGDA